MFPKLVILSAVAIFLRVEGARKLKRRSSDAEETTEATLIAGVPLLNNNHASADSQVWNVVVRAGSTDEEVKSLCDMGKCIYAGHPGKGGVPVFSVEATREELKVLLEKDSGIAKFVEPDSSVAKSLADVGTSVPYGLWGLDRIGVSKRASKGKGTHIYVIDSGIRMSHSEFGGRAIPAYDVHAWFGKTCKAWSSKCADDFHGHGTHIAGTAAGATYGVAPQAALHAVKVLKDDSSAQSSWLYEGLDWVAQNFERPAVATLNLLKETGVQSAMKESVDAAVQAGVTVVVEAGNHNSDACLYSPAFVPSAITVGSTTSGNKKSSFSNYGSCTNIWAPGSDVLSGWNGRQSDTSMRSGTSMACAHVAGGAALVLEADPSKKSSAVLEELLRNSRVNVISGLQPGDTNALLYVGADGPDGVWPRP